MPIVEAVAVSASSLSPQRKELAKRIEAAMVEAVQKACADGLRLNEDAAQIRERMMAAREEVLRGPERQPGLARVS